MRKRKLPIILPSIIINGFIDILLVFYFYTYILNSWSYMVNTTLYSKPPTYKPSSCEISKEVNVFSVSVRHEWNCSLPSISCCWWSFSSTISHLQLLQSVTLLLFLPDHLIPVPVCQLLYCTTVFFKVLYCKD